MERAVDKRVDHRVRHSETENPAHTASIDTTDGFRERMNYKHHLSVTHFTKPKLGALRLRNNNSVTTIVN